MSSIKNLSSLGCALGLTLGVTFSGAALAAGPITDNFTSGNALTAAQMTTIRNAVNDLLGNVPSTSCRTNAGAVDTGATRVGPLCVDNVRQPANQTWNAAVNFCRNAGKRLMTPGEYMAAKNQAGAALGMNTNGELEWVDAVASKDAPAAPNTGTSRGRLTVGYMGPQTAINIGGNDPVPVDGEIFFATNINYDTPSAFIFYRCAR